MLEYKKQVDGDFRGKQANLEANEKALKKRNQVLELKNKFIIVLFGFKHFWVIKVSFFKLRVQ